MKPTMDLEIAQAVVNAERERQQAAKNAELRKLVGRFFKYRNSYGVGAPPGGWWMYGAPRKVESWGRVSGLTFQLTSSGAIEIEATGGMGGIEYPNGGGWTEIAPREFWGAAKKLTALVGKRLARSK